MVQDISSLYKKNIINIFKFLFGHFLNSSCRFLFTDIFPLNPQGEGVTREFLQKVIDLCLDFVKDTNDRNVKILDFHHPEEMKRLLDLDLPEKALPLQQLIDDCRDTLKFQVKTGKWIF